MPRYEFQVVPAPRRGEKARGARSAEERFALALTRLMNHMGGEGWDYVRADTLPCDERSGLRGVKTTYQNMLVFRRPLAATEREADDGPALSRSRAAAGRPNGPMPASLSASRSEPLPGPQAGPLPDPPLSAPAPAEALPAGPGRDEPVRADPGNGDTGKVLPRLRLDVPTVFGKRPPALGPATGSAAPGPATNGRD